MDASGSRVDNLRRFFTVRGGGAGRTSTSTAAAVVIQQDGSVAMTAQQTVDEDMTTAIEVLGEAHKL